MLLKMVPFVLAVLLLPCVILADTQCPGGDISCPEGTTCCTVGGKQLCCDEDDPLAIVPLRATPLYMNSTDEVLQNNWGFGCNSQNCFGKCCNMACCPYVMAACCPSDKCCSFGESCCGYDSCCPMMSKCCGSWCCTVGSECGSGDRKCVMTIKKGKNAAATLASTAATVFLLWLAVKMVSHHE